ncbi:hypothetical protein EK904_004042 [Melospiza melodia maxima]|nr:hypothetical protein EK904_004042 [Melospiza melodia maxima]
MIMIITEKYSVAGQITTSAPEDKVLLDHGQRSQGHGGLWSLVKAKVIRAENADPGRGKNFLSQQKETLMLLLVNLQFVVNADGVK